MTAGQSGTAVGAVAGNMNLSNYYMSIARSGIAERVVSQHVAGNVTLLGRDRELAKITEALLARPAGRQPTVRVLSGMGGVGKTSLARAYAQQHLDDYGVVWWVRAEDPTAIDMEFRSLLEIVLSAGEAAQVRDAAATACAWLGNRRERWLLILDNVPNAAAVHGLIPARGPGHVLITTQATNWPNPAIALPVDPLGVDNAVELLMTLSLDEDKSAARELAEQLDGLPLALTQAASFVRANAIDLATYTRFYRDRSADLLADAQPDDYSHTVATTWQVAIDKLPESAHNLLKVLAYYAPDAVPISLITPGEIPLLPDEFAIRRAIGELRGHSLITAGPEGTINVHRLIQHVTRHNLPATDWITIAARLLVAALPSRPVTMAKLAVWSTVHTHASTLVDHGRDDDPTLFDLRRQLAVWTGEAGNARAARNQLSSLVRTQAAVLGPEHPETLRTTSHLGFWSFEADDIADAKEIFERLLPMQSRVVGAEHPNTLRTRYRMAQVVKVDDPVRAREILAELLPACHRVHGGEHRDTLAVQAELAIWISETGEYHAVLDSLREVLQFCEQILGSDDPDTLTARNNLAVTIANAGDLTTGFEMLEELFPDCVRVLGAEHEKTLMIYTQLAIWNGRRGNPVNARHMMLGLLTLLKRGLGPRHPIYRKTEQALASLNPSTKTQSRTKKNR